MKAKFVNEIQKFERGIDPKDAMGIGDVETRQILKDIDAFKKEIENALTLGTDINFKDLEHKIEHIKISFKVIIRRFLTNKFNMTFDEYGQGIYKDATITISPSNSGMSYYITVWCKNESHELPASQSLHAMEQKLKKLFKQLGI